MNTVVSYRAVSKHYGDQVAVADLNLDIQQGEFLTLLGPSGSGKTSALRMLAGLESVTSGSIHLNGKRIEGLAPEKRGLGMVFQQYALFPNMTVAQNIAYPLSIRRFSKSEIAEKVQQALAMTDLTMYADRYPVKLSGGQQQRVALARAFVYGPSVLLMDEPLGALDRNLRDQMRTELKNLQRRIGATVLYVTHDQDEALAMSDRIAILHKGTLQQLAPPREVYEHPANSFVANFVGDSVTFAGELQQRGEVTKVRIEELGVDVHAASTGVSCQERNGTVSVRPERLVISTEEPELPNRFSGRVQNIEYLGVHEVVQISLASGCVLRATRGISHDPLHINEDVWVGWHPNDTRFLSTVV